MDLPPDKAKLLKNYDNEKKWDIICDQVRACLVTSNVNFILLSQEMVQAKDPPSHYLTKLRTYLDPKASRSHRVSSLFFFHYQRREIIAVQINSWPTSRGKLTTRLMLVMTLICALTCPLFFFSVLFRSSVD